MIEGDPFVVRDGIHRGTQPPFLNRVFLTRFGSLYVRKNFTARLPKLYDCFRSNLYLVTVGRKDLTDQERKRIVMKNVVVKGLVKFGLLAVFAMIATGVTANAQTLQYKVTANIPFDFTITDKKLPAGKYSIVRAQNSNGDLVLQISSADGQQLLSRLTIPVYARDAAKQGVLVFRQYGDEYFLYEIWPAGGQTGRAFPKSRAERDLQRQGNNAKVARVIL